MTEGDSKLVNFGEMIQKLSNRQYFDCPYIFPNGNDSFVDVGCFDGKTSIDFVNWSKGKYNKIYALEPDNNCYRKCLESLSEYNNVSVIELGAWNKKETLHFEASSDSMSSISNQGCTTICVDRLDIILKNEQVSFMKMDIEGAEYEALEGAKGIIQSQKPCLAISVYHKPEDIWKLTNFILEINPEYRFCLRNYTFYSNETVLYAI